MKITDLTIGDEIEIIYEDGNVAGRFAGYISTIDMCFVSLKDGNVEGVKSKNIRLPVNLGRNDHNVTFKGQQQT